MLLSNVERDLLRPLSIFFSSSTARSVWLKLKAVFTFHGFRKQKYELKIFRIQIWNHSPSYHYDHWSFDFNFPRFFLTFSGNLGCWTFIYIQPWTGCAYIIAWATCHWTLALKIALIDVLLIINISLVGRGKGWAHHPSKPHPTNGSDKRRLSTHKCAMFQSLTILIKNWVMRKKSSLLIHYELIIPRNAYGQWVELKQKIIIRFATFLTV